MKREQLIQTIRGELEGVNKKIDLKIIKGRQYKKESKRHKFLLSQLAYQNQLADAARFRESSRFTHRTVLSNWMTRTARVVSTFMF